MTRSNPDISVVIPTYNRLWSLPKAIESCRHDECVTQIVVVDDGSTDGTWEWLGEQRDVLAIRTRNWGKCWAVNTGVRAATGEFVRFLDSDDWLIAGANDRQLSAAREARADLVLAGNIFVDETGAAIGEGAPQTGDLLANWVRQVWSGTEFTYCACLIRRSLAAEIPHRSEYLWHDVLLLMEVALTDPVIARVDSPAVVVREHSRDRRISAFRGLDTAVEAHGNVAMCQRILAAVREKRGPATDAEGALLYALWIEARRAFQWDPVAATELAGWIHNQDAGFVPPVPRALRTAYRWLGFNLAERLVAVRRKFVN